MRIALETLSCDSQTGIGRIVRALAGVFVARGHAVDIVTTDPGDLAGQKHVHRAARVPGSRALSKVVFSFEERRIVKRLDHDIILSFGVGRMADVVAAQSCHKGGKKVLHRYALDGGDGRNWGLYDRVSLRDEKVLLTSEKTKRIIACSDRVKHEIIQEYKVSPGRITVIPNGVSVRNIDRSKKAVAQRKKEGGIDTDEHVLLFVGNEFGRKGLRTILEAISRPGWKRIRLLVAGGGNIAAYSRLAHVLGVAERVTFLGCVREIERLFDCADLFVFPTLYEPFGMVVVEAMASGVPVITSRACGAVEGMTPRVHGLYLDDPSSIEEVAGAIQRLVSDEALRTSLSNAGREKAREFSWDLIGDKMLAVLSGVCGETRADD
jgi:UDP-glucose:(heptosyl)LPS alpha-1,3-glucosyltransferase